MAKKMTRARARKLAIEAIRSEIKKIAWDANAHDDPRIQARYPYAVRCSERKAELLAAIEMIEGWE